MILIIDNDDPAINVIANALRISGDTVRVVDNTEITLQGIHDLRPNGLVFSEGAGAAKNAGITIPTIRTFAPIVPILGVGMGHRAIGIAFGASVSDGIENDATGSVTHDGFTLFKGLDDPFEVSSTPAPVLRDDEFPVSMEIAAQTPNGTIMAVRHRGFKTEGIQFRLEEMDPSQAEHLVRNWLDSLYDINEEAFEQLKLPTQEQQDNDGGSKSSDPNQEETLVYEDDGTSMYDRIMDQEKERREQEEK